MHMKRRSFVLMLIYFIAAVTVLLIWGVTQSTLGSAYRATAEYGYEHAFGEVVTASKNLSAALHRGQYTTGAEMSAEVCSDICGNCLAAGMTMAALPFSTQELEKTAAFIGVAGDYAKSLLRSCAADGFRDAERENMAQLHETAYAIYQSLEKLQNDINDGTVLMDAPENSFVKNENVLSAAMLKAESEMGDTPELDYDGVYTKTAAKPCDDPIGEKKAKKLAAEFLEKDAGELETLYSADSGVCAFSFDGGSILVDGRGKVLSVSSERTVCGDTESGVLEDEAVKFLEKAGFSDMVMTESQRDGSVQYVTFECTKSGVRCENKRIRVGIAGDDKSLYFFDATAYVENEDLSADTTPALTEAEAARAIPDGLTIRGAELMLAETAGGSTRLCWCFDGVGLSDEAVRVYVDATSGEQFRIRV